MAVSLCVDISNGFIQFKFSLPSFCVISVEQFNEIVENVVNTVDQFYPLIMKLQWSDTSVIYLFYSIDFFYYFFICFLCIVFCFRLIQFTN